MAVAIAVAVAVAVTVAVVVKKNYFTMMTMSRVSRDFQWTINHIYSYIYNYITTIKYTRQNNI